MTLPYLLIYDLHLAVSNANVFDTCHSQASSSHTVLLFPTWQTHISVNIAILGKNSSSVPLSHTKVRNSIIVILLNIVHTIMSLFVSHNVSSHHPLSGVGYLLLEYKAGSVTYQSWNSKHPTWWLAQNSYWSCLFTWFLFVNEE